MIVRCVAKGVALLTVCVLALCVSGVASADDTANLASVESWQDHGCGSNYAWHVINGLKDSSIRATVAVQRTNGTVEADMQYVYDLAGGGSSFVSCTSVQASDGLYNVTVRLVGAERV
jgi:uncharacterized membrane protein (DUF441 family)